MLVQVSSNLRTENTGSSTEFKRECARFNLSLSCTDLSVLANEVLWLEHVALNGR